MYDNIRKEITKLECRAEELEEFVESLYADESVSRLSDEELQTADKLAIAIEDTAQKLDSYIDAIEAMIPHIDYKQVSMQEIAYWLQFEDLDYKLAELRELLK